MKIGVTGHRPGKLWGYGPEPEWEALKGLLKVEFSVASEIISGMALGVDTVAVEAAIEVGIPFIAAVPFEGQEKRWPIESQRKYKNLLGKAEKVIVVSEGGYSPQKMMIRNIWIVDNSDLILALWNGSEGGTGHCVKYAQRQGKNLIIISPKEIEKMVKRGK